MAAATAATVTFATQKWAPQALGALIALIDPVAIVHYVQRQGRITVQRRHHRGVTARHHLMTPPYKEEKVTEKGNRAKGNQDHDDYIEALDQSSSSSCSSPPTTIAPHHDFIRQALEEDGAAGILLTPASDVRLSHMAQSIRTGVFDSSGLDPDRFVEWMTRAAEITAAKHNVRNAWPFFEGVLRNQVAEKTADTPPSTRAPSRQPPNDDDPQGYFTSKYQHLYQ